MTNFSKKDSLPISKIVYKDKLSFTRPLAVKFGEHKPSYFVEHHFIKYACRRNTCVSENGKHVSVSTNNLLDEIEFVN